MTAGFELSSLSTAGPLPGAPAVAARGAGLDFTRDFAAALSSGEERAPVWERPRARLVAKEAGHATTAPEEHPRAVVRRSPAETETAPSRVRRDAKRAPAAAEGDGFVPVDEKMAARDRRTPDVSRKERANADTGDDARPGGDAAAPVVAGVTHAEAPPTPAPAGSTDVPEKGAERTVTPGTSTPPVDGSAGGGTAGEAEAPALLPAWVSPESAPPAKPADAPVAAVPAAVVPAPGAAAAGQQAAAPAAASAVIAVPVARETPGATLALAASSPAQTVAPSEAAPPDPDGAEPESAAEGLFGPQAGELEGESNESEGKAAGRAVTGGDVLAAALSTGTAWSGPAADTAGPGAGKPVAAKGPGGRLPGSSLSSGTAGAARAAGGWPGPSPGDGAIGAGQALWDGVATGRLAESAEPVAARHEFDEASLEAAAGSGTPAPELPALAAAPRERAGDAALPASAASEPGTQVFEGLVSAAAAPVGEPETSTRRATGGLGRLAPETASVAVRPGAAASSPWPVADAAVARGAVRTAAPEAPAAARAAAALPAEIEAAPLAERGSLKELKLEIRAPGPGDEARSVRLELVEQNGRMEVALRTSDPDMAADLRDSLPALVERLGTREASAPGTAGDGRPSQDSTPGDRGHQQREQPAFDGEDETGRGARRPAVMAAWREALHRSFRAA